MKCRFCLEKGALVIWMESSGKMKISTEEFESLKRKVGESGNMSERKIAAAMAVELKIFLH